MPSDGIVAKTTLSLLLYVLMALDALNRFGAGVMAKDLNRKSNATYKFRLRLFDNETTSQAWIFPKTVEVTKRIYAEIQLRPVENSVIDDDILAIPRDCFFSVNSNPASDDPHHMVLQVGCSVDKANAIVYKRDDPQRDDSNYHQQSQEQSPNTHGVRFSILIDSFYFPNRQFMFFHCQATVCSSKENRSDKTIQMCPKNGFCASDKSSSLDDVNKAQTTVKPSVSYVNVFSGPLRPVSPRLPKTASDDDDGGRIPSWTIDGKRRPPPLYPKSSQAAANLKRFEQPRPAAQQQQQCAPCPVDEFSAIKQQPDDSHHEFDGGLKIKGIDTLTVFCIATSSFLVGVLLMAGLCYVHKITEPKKCSNTATSCHKPLVDLQHRSLLSSSTNRFYPSANNNNNNSAENTVSTNCVGGACFSDAGAAAPPAYSANSVLLLAKPKLKLPCCYDPVDQNDESPNERRPTDGKRPLICDNVKQKV